VQVHDLIGRGVAKARQDLGWTQEQTSRRFRAVGLSAWRKGTVGQLEAGLRRPTIAEVLLMARALHVGVADLFPGGNDELVQLEDSAEVSAVWIREMLTAGIDPNCPVEQMPHERLPVDAILAEVSKRTQELNERDAPFVEAIQEWDNQHDATLTAADLFASHERPTDAERHAARRLGVEARYMKLASRARWHNLDFEDERDRRVGDIETLEPRSRQARRGLVTRELISELRAVFDEIKVSKSGDGEGER
jgi:transcriptional regulator with XRE-family HTH domain